MQFGYGSSNITPNSPEFLSGFMDRATKSDGILDELFMKALFIKQENTSILILSIETLVIPYHYAKEVEAKIKTMIEVDKVFICATHTHSAPSVVAYSWLPACSEEYQAVLDEALVDVMTQIKANYADGELLVKQIYFDGVGKNRIHHDLENNETYLSLLIFRSKERDVSILQYNCHPTVLNAQSLKVSGDYISALVKRYEQRFGDAMFLQGASGDISTRFNRTKDSILEQKEMFGERLYNELVHMHEQVEKIELPSFFYQTTSFPIEFKKIDEEASIKEIEQLKKELEITSKDDLFYRNLVTKIQGYQVMIGTNKLKSELEKEIEISALHLDDFPIVFISGEPFSKLHQALHNQKGMVVSYCNGYPGYIYSTDYLDTYEAISSILSPTTFETCYKTIEVLLNQKISNR